MLLPPPGVATIIGVYPMSDMFKPPDAGGLATAWIAAVNIDLSAALAVGRAAARTVAELSPATADLLRARLEEEAAALDARGGLESSTAATLVR